MWDDPDEADQPLTATAAQCRSFTTTTRTRAAARRARRFLVADREHVEQSPVEQMIHDDQYGKLVSTSCHPLRAARSTLDLLHGLDVLLLHNVCIAVRGNGDAGERVRSNTSAGRPPRRSGDDRDADEGATARSPIPPAIDDRERRAAQPLHAEQYGSASGFRGTHPVRGA